MSTATAIAPVSLYHITEDLADLEHSLLESGGEITEDLEEEYAELLEMHGSKVESYIAMIRRFEATAEGIKAERERLQAAEKTMENAARSLKDRLRDAMQRRGEAEHLTRLGKVKLQRSGSTPVVLKVAPEQLPTHFQRVKVGADLTSLKHALQEGDDGAAQYAELGEPSYYVRIY